MRLYDLKAPSLRELAGRQARLREFPEIPQPPAKRQNKAIPSRTRVYREGMARQRAVPASDYFMITSTG